MNNLNQDAQIILKCDQCLSMPFINFDINNPNIIIIKCDQCNSKQKFLIIDYINSISHQNLLYNKNKNEKIEFYCLEEHLHFGITTLHLHQAHLYVPLKKIASTLDLSLFEENLDKINNYLSNYYSELKRNVIEQFTDKVTQINEIFENNLVINKCIFQLLKIIFSNYTEENYQSILNIRNNLNISLLKIEMQNDYNSLILKIEKNYIISKQKIDIQNIKSVKEIASHKNLIYTLLILNDGRLASCSADCHIIIYQPPEYSVQVKFKAHSKTVSYICQLSSDHIVSCSYDNTIKIWNINGPTPKCEYTLTSHQNEVRKVIPITNCRMASCSKDRSIIIYNDSPPYKIIKKLNGHEDWVDSIIQLRGKETLISGSTGNDKTLRFWNLVSYECESIVWNIKCCYMDSLKEIDNNRVIVGGADQIAIVSTKTHQIITLFNKNIGFVNAFLLLRDGNILIGKGTKGSPGFFYHLCSHSLCELSRNESIMTFGQGTRCFISLSYNTFAVGAYNGIVSIWEY